MKTVGYMGWLGNNNIGDEVCFKYISSLLPKNIKILSFDVGGWKYEKLPDLVIVGGGTLLNLNYDVRIKHLLTLKDKKIPIVVWGTGVQPYSKPMNEKVLNLLKYALFVGVRGPLSHNKLKENNIHSEVIGDPGFLIKSTRKPSIGVGINIGDTRGKLFGTEARVVQEVSKIVWYLTNKGINTTLFSMWKHDESFLKQLPSGSRILIRSWDPSIQNMLSFMNTCYCVIGMKLHANVMAASCGVPFISLTYREKGLDFAKSVGLEKWSIQTDHPNLSARVIEMYRLLSDYYEIVSDRLLKYQDGYIVKHKKLALVANGILEGKQ